ncbi:MAG: alpha/beta hydrolase [Candidatus Cloacimonetes bacterium]|nr:alpha/beta hydrolase [Candidatus Cloacimonadota bacterium]
MINIKEKVELCGFKQTIHIVSKDANKPVLLFLHGGPGISNRHSVVASSKDLLDCFTVVAWDQRGTAGSFKGCKKETLTVDQLIEDANALVAYLCRKFNKEKIFTIGGSWGSLLGTALLKKHPERIAAFVGFGQFVDGPKNELLSWQYCVNEATKANDQKSLDILRKISEPVNGVYKDGFKGMMKQRNIMMKYGGYSKNEKKRSYWNAIVKPILLSGEYTISDIFGFIKGYRFVLETMWDEVAAIDFKQTHTTFKSPIFIFDGRLDNNTPSELVEEWFHMIEAPVKELHWFENSGHNPMSDESEKFKKLLKEKLTSIAIEQGY